MPQCLNVSEEAGDKAGLQRSGTNVPKRTSSIDRLAVRSRQAPGGLWSRAMKETVGAARAKTPPCSGASCPTCQLGRKAEAVSCRALA